MVVSYEPPIEFPGKLPYITSDVPPTTNNSHHMYMTGVTIAVKVPKQTKFLEHTFLHAMLACFRIVDEWAELVPYDYNGRASDPETVVTSIAMLKDSKIDVNQFLEDPIRKRVSNEYVTRIKVRTSMKISDILQDRDVKECLLRQEKVYPEVNNLGSAHLTNEGFLYKAFPRSDSLALYTERIRTALSNKGPDFHLVISSIFTEKQNQQGALRTLSQHGLK